MPDVAPVTLGPIESTAMKPQRIVLSRKGFDSGSGGCPSPIFPDRSLCSIPIPDSPFSSSHSYRSIQYKDTNIGDFLEDLTEGLREPWTGAHTPHLDPDIRHEALPRPPEWRGLFGQAGNAQSHLKNQGIAAGDLFLFFGLFREVHTEHGRWAFRQDAQGIHVLWGWLQVAEIQPVDVIRNNPTYQWTTYHSHFAKAGDPRNTLYIAANELDLVLDTLSTPGFGVFPTLREDLVLTNPDGTTSQWRLPRWFYPVNGRRPLTYHGDPNRWECDHRHAYLDTVGRGQEFVLHTDDYPEASDWASNLIAQARGATQAQPEFQERS